MPQPADDEPVAKPAPETVFSLDSYRARLALLTPRCRQLCEQLVLGRDLRVVAAEMGITLNTARNHMKVAYERCEVAGSRVALTAFLVFGIRGDGRCKTL